MKNSALSISLSLFLVAISTDVAPAQNNNDQIATVINATFKSMEQEDIASLMSYWSKDSPEYLGQKQGTQDFFALIENLHITILSLSHWNVGPEKATVRIRFRMGWVDSNSKQQMQDSSFWIAHFVRKEGGWKWWDREGIVLALAQIKSKAGRSELLEEEKDLLTPETVSAIGDVAVDEFKKGNLEESARISALALEVARFMNDKRALARYHFDKARLLRLMNDQDKALSNLQIALGLSREAKDHDLEPVILGNISTTHLEAGRAEEAVKGLETQRSLFRETGQKLQEGSALINIGNAYHILGNYPKALQAYEEALLISRLSTLLDREGEAIALNGLGTVYSSMGRFGDGLLKYKEGLEFSRKWNITSEEVAALQNMAEVYLRTGYYGEAEEKFRTAKAIYERIRDKRGEATIQLGIANIHARSGRYAAALRIYDQVLKLFQDEKDKEAESYVWDAIAGIYYSLGRYKEALEAAHKSLDFSKERGDKKRQGAELNNIANILVAMGRHDDALATLKDSFELALGSDDKAIVLNNLGEMYQHKGELDKALEAYEESVKIKQVSGNKLAEAGTLNNIALVHSIKGNKKKALELLNHALDLAAPLDDVSSTLPIHSNIGDVHFGEHNWQAAVDAYTKAVDRIEKVRHETREGSFQISFLKQYIAPYHRLTRSYVELNLNEEALLVSEHAKARTLRDILARGYRFEATLTKPEHEEKNLLQRRVSMTEERLAQARQGKNEALVQTIQEELSAARGAYDLFLSHLFVRHSGDINKETPDLQRTTFTQLNSALLAKSSSLTLVSYVASEDGLLLFVMTPGKSPGLTVHPLKNDKGGALKHSDLTALVDQFRLRVATDDAPYKTLSRQLYDLLIAPVEKHLAGKNQLIIIPDGVLGALPFQALMNQKGEFLIQRFSVSYAPSATALVSMMALDDRRRAQVWPKRLAMLAVGRSRFPDIPAYEGRDLPFAARQAEQIAALFGVSELTDEAATEEKIKSLITKVRYAHFATHAELSTDAPMYSAIILARTKNEDGVLYARELANLSLNTEMVVLAACETGLGQLVNGEGIMGSSWALFAAGSPSIAVTQWKVLDESTTLLMREFYGELKAPGKRKTTKAKALQRAQLKLIGDGKHEHPYFWAPFILIGGWQ